MVRSFGQRTASGSRAARVEPIGNGNSFTNIMTRRNKTDLDKQTKKKYEREIKEQVGCGLVQIIGVGIDIFNYLFIVYVSFFKRKIYDKLIKSRYICRLFDGNLICEVFII